MDDSEEGLFNKKFLNDWYNNYHKLKIHIDNHNKDIEGEIDEELTHWAAIQRRTKHMLPEELKDKLAELNVDLKVESHSWDSMCWHLAHFVQENGHSYLPDEEKHEQLKDWLIRQIISRRLLPEGSFERLDKLGVDWDMPISRDHWWEQIYWRLNGFY
jgi:hypothetical protein